MIIKHKHQRVGVFIDAQNVYHSSRNLYGGNVIFKNVLDDCVAGRNLVRAIAYVIRSESAEEQPFFNALTKLGVETKSKDLQIFVDGSKKADWDVGMAVDAIRMAHKLDAIILVTGDGDFVPLVEYLKHACGVQVEVVGFRQSSSLLLQEMADNFLDLSLDHRRYVMVQRFERKQNNVKTSTKTYSKRRQHGAHDQALE